jgi:hypothetical protein
MEAILSHSKLKMKIEEFLYELIISLMNKDFSFFSLFEFVRFEYLSFAKISYFSKIVCEHFGLWNVSILSAICVHLIQNVSPQALTSRRELFDILHANMEEMFTTVELSNSLPISPLMFLLVIM